MGTIAWLTILAGIILISTGIRGRAMHITEDLPDALLALMSADPKALQEVLTRKGDDDPNTVEAGKDAAGAIIAIGKNIYGLSDKTKPAAVAVANHFGPAHGIKTAYGWSATGSVENSDHPKGLAVDLMTSSKAQGDALAEDLIANHAAYHLTYIIWYKRIYNFKRGDGWRPYHGPRDHTDHVHVSVEG